MSVPLRAVGKNFALQIVQGGKQRQCAVAIVIVRARGHVPLAQGKTRLASFQRLALAFLITTQHDGLLRRRQIQADNVPELLLELPVVGQFEGASLVRLQIVAEPQLLNPTLGNTRLLGHAPATPPGAVLERLSDLREHGVQSVGRDSRGPSRTGIIPQTCQAMPGETTTPLAHCLFGRLQFVCDFLVGPIQGSQQYDSGSERFGLACARRPRESFQLFALYLIQNDFRRGTRHSHTLKMADYTSKDLVDTALVSNAQPVRFWEQGQYPPHPKSSRTGTTPPAVGLPPFDGQG